MPVRAPDASNALESSPAAPGSIARPSPRALFQYFLMLGATGFGGPIALVGYMEREFVDRRRWATAQELRDGIAFSQLAPGPLAAQLAIYLGWLCGGIRGATLSGVAFVGPSFVMVIVLAALYARFGGIGWLQGAFYGIGAAVIAIVARSALKLTRSALGGDRLLWCLFAINAVVTASREDEVVVLFVLSGVIVVIMRTSTRDAKSLGAGAVGYPWMLASVAGAMSAPTSLAVFMYFASAGLFVFGSGLAIVPFLHGGVVQQHHWLTERQFLDAVAVALITPGPVVITVAFIGYLVTGTLGAIAAAAGVFAPVYLLTLAFAPHFDRLKTNNRVRAFVDGVTAAAAGAIAGAAFVLGRRAIIDLTTAAIAIVTLVILMRARRVPEPLLILAAGLVGVMARGSR
jgi:chromate transporter